MMCRLESCASTIAQEGWWGQLLCHRQLRGPIWLFICAFHLFPSVQLSPCSHRPLGDFGRECLGWSSSRLPIVSLALWQKDKSRDALVRLCCQPCREPDVRESSLSAVFLRRSCFLRTKFTLVPWEAVRSCSRATYCTQHLQNTDWGSTAEIDVPSLKPACRLQITLTWDCPINVGER